MTDLKIPFSFFDFFGYLFPGFIFTTTIIWLLIPDDPMTKIIDFFNSIKDFKYIFSFVIFIVIYGLGHVVSSFGSSLFEGLLVARLGYPSDNLFKENRGKNLFFKKFRKNYSITFRNAFEETFKGVFGTFDKKDKFKLCFTLVKEKCPVAAERLAIFISLYDFSRNSAMALIFLTVVSIYHGYYQFSLFFISFAYIFTLRYLKFYSHYADEVFRSFYVYFKNK